MFNMSKKQMVDVLAGIETSGAFGFVSVTHKLPLKSVVAPDNLKEVTLFFVGIVSAGMDYEAEVRKQLIAEGKDPNSFKAKGTYAVPVGDNKILYAYSGDKAELEGNHYVRIFPNLHNFKKAVVVKDAESQDITANWPAIRDQYFGKPRKNGNQGLKNPVEVRMYSLDSVKYLKRGEVFINEITEEIAKITVPAIKGI